MKLLLLLLTIIFSFGFCFPANAEMKVARINDKDGFTNIREGQGADFKIVATVKADEFFYCEQSSADWWKVTVLEWTDRGQQIEGFIFKDRVQFLSTLSDSAKQNLVQSIFENQKQFATKFQNAWKSNDSLEYQTTVRALENYSDVKYTPILNIFLTYFCETQDSVTLNKFFAAMWADKGSADEMPSFTIGDCFVCRTDLVMRQLKNIKSIEERNSIIGHIEWGLRNHFNVPEEGLGIPDNTNEKQTDVFNRLMKQLKTISP